MRLVPRHWSNETWVCSIRGHVAPAATVAALRSGDEALGIEHPDGSRLCRCLRCDAWVSRVAPTVDSEAVQPSLPPPEALPRPRRGKALEDAVVLRLIAIERGIHSVLFGVLAVILAIVEVDFASLHISAMRWANRLDDMVNQTGQQPSRNVLSRAVHDAVGLHRGTVAVLLATAVVYAVVEGVEAVGLWRERRWAEYLTVMATVGFLPFEVHELLKKVTAFRVAALVVNLAVLAWLLWTKRLFGLRGGHEALLRQAVEDEPPVVSAPHDAPRHVR